MYHYAIRVCLWCGEITLWPPSVASLALCSQQMSHLYMESWLELKRRHGFKKEARTNMARQDEQTQSTFKANSSTAPMLSDVRGTSSFCQALCAFLVLAFEGQAFSCLWNSCGDSGDKNKSGGDSGQKSQGLSGGDSWVIRSMKPGLSLHKTVVKGLHWLGRSES